MKYITGIHALNLPCDLETCGDWHTSAIQWVKPQMRNSEEMFFGDYGIELNHKIPEHDELYNVANTIRALLDLLQEGTFTVAQGMNNDFICNDKYDREVFDKVYSMRQLDNWNKIDEFMRSEYWLKWFDYKEAVGEINIDAETGTMYDICRTQADIYKYAAEHKYDMERFSSDYLKSYFCQRAMDCVYSRFQLETPEECFDFIIPEIGVPSSDTYFDTKVAEWIGWMYRFIYYHTKMLSSELASKVPFNAMCQYYPRLHTIDEHKALDIIFKDSNLPRVDRRWKENHEQTQ